MTWWQTLEWSWEEITAWSAVLDAIVTAATIAWVLTIKKEPTSAMAWCLLVLFVPILGALLFVLLGYQHVHRPLMRKRRHMTHFRQRHPTGRQEATPGPADRVPASSSGRDGGNEPDTSWEGMGRLAQRYDAFPVTSGNQVAFYREGMSAYDAMLEAISLARHHVHLQTFIFRPDATGQMFLDVLTEKAREGIEVRLLYDAMGTGRLGQVFRLGKFLRPFLAAGGKCSAFLPLNPLRRHIQVNLRNHRKILVVDGRIGFTGGLNIGDEYLGKNPHFGYWRDTHLRVEGPAVAGLQRLFIEDWDFASNEHLKGSDFYPQLGEEGSHAVQVIHSGPDQTLKSIREIYFAAILRARQRLWIATPYFVPDAGILDALRLAGYKGIDVRLLGLFRPDKWLPYLAGRYYWADVMEAGVKVYQYTRGMMHSKVMLVDGQWASVGTANLDNRSMHLNFEVNCLFYSPEIVAELEESFRKDLETAIRLDPAVFSNRPFPGRLMENACRLLSPVL